MLVLLPPSETKRPGGDGAPLDLTALTFPALRPERESVIDAVVALSADEEVAARVLKLSAKRRHEIADNGSIRTAPTLPAVDRYTGVLFDALGAENLGEPARDWLGLHVVIQSAPFGPVGALDAIPAYRLAASTSVPGLPSLRRVWGPPVTAALASADSSFLLDLRSEAYAALGPVPERAASAYVRVLSADGDGTVRALNHFNKHAKGALVRALASDRPDVRGRSDFIAWAAASGWTARELDSGEIGLFV